MSDRREVLDISVTKDELAQAVCEALSDYCAHCGRAKGLCDGDDDE